MRCPFCDHEETNVKDSRPVDDDAAIRRRRECPACGKRFTTREKVEFRAVTALKNDGRREPFDPEKLTRSMHVALRKRPIEPSEIERIASGIVREIEANGDTEITTREIGEMVLSELFGLDEVGAVRYASVYQDFRSLGDYTEFLKGLAARRKNKSRDGAASNTNLSAIKRAANEE